MQPIPLDGADNIAGARLDFKLDVTPATPSTSVKMPCELEWIRDDAAANYIYIPPLTPRISPVMKLAAGEARKTTAAATSSGLPSRPTGVMAFT